MPRHDLVGDYEPAWNKEARSSNTVKQKKDAGRQKHAKGQQAEDGGHKPRPTLQRKPSERHALQQRRSISVVIKLRAPISDAPQKIAKPTIQSVSPAPCPGLRHFA